jgi:hypothetical protein
MCKKCALSAAALAASVVVSIMFASACGCRRPAVPDPQPMSVESPADEEEVVGFEFYDSESQVKGFEKFPGYEQMIKAAQFVSAQTALDGINAEFATAKDRDAFWDRAIPADKRITLRLLKPCVLCRGGVCDSCGGSGLCPECRKQDSQAGTCGFCRGDSKRQKKCSHCTCTACSQTGSCKTCNGIGTFQCPSCGGRGSISKSVSVACGSCSGRGYRMGLRNSNKPSTTLKCLLCKGSGRQRKSGSTQCRKCSGSGRPRCSSCRGSGKCASCRGAGRDTYCRECGGAGTVLVDCPRCGGSGKCSACGGQGKCHSCGGAGECATCRKSGLATVYELPVLTDWLSTPEGVLVHNARTGKYEVSSRSPGLKEIEYDGHDLSFRLSGKQLVCISSRPSFDHVRYIMKR